MSDSILQFVAFLDALPAPLGDMIQLGIILVFNLIQRLLGQPGFCSSPATCL